MATLTRGGAPCWPFSKPNFRALPRSCLVCLEADEYLSPSTASLLPCQPTGLCLQPGLSHLSSQHVNAEIMARRLVPAEGTNMEEEASWTLWTDAEEQLQRGVQNKGVV